MPSTSAETPFKLPGQPPKNDTLCNLPSTTSKEISREHVPFVVYFIVVYLFFDVPLLYTNGIVLSISNKAKKRTFQVGGSRFLISTLMRLENATLPNGLCASFVRLCTI